jgi:hypothetical protein
MTAAEAVEKCAALVEKMAKERDEDSKESQRLGNPDLARIERNEALSLRSAARLMREHVK